MEQFLGNSLVSTYLHIITTREAINFMISKRAAKYQSVDPIINDDDEEEVGGVLIPQIEMANPESKMIAEEDKAIIHAAIELLPCVLKEVFILSEILGTSIDDICEIMDIKIDQYNKLKRHAKNDLMIMLEDFHKKRND